jgi:hypothetical protein
MYCRNHGHKTGKIIEERIEALPEEMEIATNVKLNPLYIVDRKDKIESLRWMTRIIRWVLVHQHLYLAIMITTASAMVAMVEAQHLHTAVVRMAMVTIQAAVRLRRWPQR